MMRRRRLHARRAEMRRVSRPATSTCKPSASRVEWRVSSAEEALRGAFRRRSRPYRSAPRVFWVLDNGSSHRGRASIEPLQRQWPNIKVVHLPIHARWLNQIEI